MTTPQRALDGLRRPLEVVAAPRAPHPACELPR